MEIRERECDICNRKEDATHKIVFSKKLNCYLCQKHKGQLYRYGKIIDSSQKTTKEKNEYIIKENYAEIIIRNNKQEIIATAMIDLKDVERCKNIKWSWNYDGYVVGNSKEYSLHRFIMNYNGPLQVDHINRNKLDNRKQNLRIVSIFINNQNNGAKGISFDKKTNKWKVEFQRYGKYFYVGLFETEEEAIKARKIAIENAEKHKDDLLKTYTNKNENHSIGIKPSPHGKWVAKYCADGKVYHVGTFTSKEKAIAERKKAILRHKKI